VLLYANNCYLGNVLATFPRKTKEPMVSMEREGLGVVDIK